MELLNTIPDIEEIEVLVINDQSTKHVSEFQELKNNCKRVNIKFMENNTNKKGAGVCRNIGIENMKGEWVLFADSDDFFIDGFYNILEEYFDSNFEVVFFKPMSLDRQAGNEATRHKKYEKIVTDYSKEQNEVTETRLRYEFVVPWSKLINATFIKKYNLSFDEVIASNDIMFSVKAGYHMKNYSISNSKIYCVTQTIGSLTKTLSVETFDARLDVRIRYIKYLRERISKNNQEYLNLSGRVIIYYILVYKLGLKKFIKTYIELKKNKIQLLNKDYFNPYYLLVQLKKAYSEYKNNNQYYKRNDEGS